MKVSLNRITTGLVSALFVFALSSCEIPSSVRIKSSPALYLPLGSPFAGGENSLSLNEYLSVAELKKQFNQGGQGKGIDIQEWIPDEISEFAGVQAYRVRYPIINTDLSGYVKEMDLSSGMSGASGEYLPGGSELPIPIPLDSLSFASNIENVVIKVTLSFKDTGTTGLGADIPMPAGVNVTFSGTVAGGTPSGSTWSSPTIPVFNPATDEISITVTGVPLGTWFKPELDFDWESANIKLDDSSEQKGTYNLDFSGFSSFMGGDGISFADVKGYLYVQRPPNASVTLTKQWKKQDNTNDGPSEEVPQNEKEIDWNNFTVPTGTPIDLTELFNKKLTFNYIFTMASARITNGGGGPSEKFIVDMVILLPLEFKLDGVPKSTNFLGYRKLELDGMGGGGSEDLLGRTKGEDDIFSGLKSVKIKFYDYKNNIIEGLWLGIKSKPILSLGKGETAPDPIEFTGEELEPPFNPTFELLVPDGESFKILRPQDGDSTIDFSIAVEVKTNLDIAL